MSPPEILLIAVAGFVAGTVNAIAGGGSLVSFPALLAVGFPAITANVTNSVSMFPGYASSIVGFRKELEGHRATVMSLAVTASGGGVAGAVLLLALPSGVFDAVVPWCVLFASGLLAAQRRLSARLSRTATRSDRAEHQSVVLHLLLFVAGAYGAYFGGGLGVVLLGILGLYLTSHLHTVIGLKNVLSFVVSTVSVVAFVVFAPIAWSAFAVVAPASFVGGFAGSRLAKVIPPRVLRWTIVATGIAVGVVMLLNG